MAKPVKLAHGREWQTRTAARAHFKDILSRYNVGDEVPQGADHDDLGGLLLHYDRMLAPGSATKTGAGILHFSKGRAGGEGYSTECFFVHRIDGTVEDFSYIHAINS